MMKKKKKKTTITLMFFFCIFAHLSHYSHEYTLQLVHGDSLFGENETWASRDGRWLKMSQQRYEQHLAYLDDFETPGQTDLDGLLLARFQLGAPVSTTELTVIDTGSGFMWVVCEKSDFMLGDYSCINSRECHRIGCDDVYCWDVPNNNRCKGASNPNLCTFFLWYMNGFTVDDDAVFDEAFFGGVTSGGVRLLFGCASVRMRPDHGGTGIMGLANTNLSVASQIHGKFSYFVGDLSDRYYNRSKLVLGNNAEFKGNWTPILNYSAKVYVTLLQIKVDGEVLDISPDIFEGTINGGGTIIDTGAPLTYFRGEAYKELRASLDYYIPGYDDYPGITDLEDLCRYDILENEVPEVRFDFDGDAELVLGFPQLFRQVRPNKHCLNVRASSKVSPD